MILPRIAGTPPSEESTWQSSKQDALQSHVRLELNFSAQLAKVDIAVAAGHLRVFLIYMETLMDITLDKECDKCLSESTLLFFGWNR